MIISMEYDKKQAINSSQETWKDFTSDQWSDKEINHGIKQSYQWTWLKSIEILF